ncbi:MAG: anti-sigma factor family protein [Elainellaceae cyanobacterium]
MSSQHQHPQFRRPANHRSHPIPSKAVNRDSQPIPFSTDESWEGLKRDRFELLSAFLDGEVTPAEREQVLALLEHDQTMQCLYARLIKLRRGLQSMPVPTSSQTVEDILTKVQARTERRPRRTAAAWGGMAIAALFVSAIMGSLALPGAINQIPDEEPKSELSDSPEGESDLDKVLDESDGAIDVPAPDEKPAEAISSDELMIPIAQPVVPLPIAIEPVEEVEAASAAEADSDKAQNEADRFSAPASAEAPSNQF